MRAKPSEAIRSLNPDAVGDVIRRHLKGPHRARARLLQLLVRRPEITTAELATHIERSPSTVRHYLALLRDGGLGALIPSLQHARKLTWQERDLLLAEVRQGRFSSYSQIIRWVEGRFGVRYTVSGLRRYLAGHFRLTRRLVPDVGDEQRLDLTAIPQFSAFLNMLPVTTDYVDWVRGLQDAFSVLFPALERGSISILLNRSASVEGESRPNVRLAVLDITNDGAIGEKRGERHRRSVDTDHDDMANAVLAAMKRAGRDPEAFHPPVDFIARLAPESWVGRIFFFFPIDEPDPRREVELRLELLRPFLAFCLSDGIARDRVRHPQNRPFQIAVDRLSGHVGFTPRERQVAMLYLSGSTNEQISEELTISSSTVANHIRNIHAKCGTYQLRELIRLLWEA